MIILIQPLRIEARDIKSEVDRLFRQASEGGVRFVKLVQPSKDSLSAMKDSAAKYLAAKLNTTDAREKVTLLEIYRGIGPVATPYLVQALQTQNKDQLKTTCRCLAEVNDTAAIDALLITARHPDYTVRAEAITAIGRNGGGARTAARLQPLMGDSVADVRKSCAAAFGRLKSVSSLPSLLRGLNDPSFSVRLSAYDALVTYDSLAGKGIASLLETASDYNSRVLSLRLCGQLKITLAKDLVGQYMNNADPAFRGWAIWSYGRIVGAAARDKVAARKLIETNLFVKSLLDETLNYIDTVSTHE